MLKLKLQYFGYKIRRADSLEKTLSLGKIEGRRRGQQRIRWLDSITDSMDMSLRKFWKIVKERERCVLQSTGSQGVRHDRETEQQHVCVCVAQSFLTLCNPCSLLGSSIHGISRQEHWSMLPFPSPGDLPDPGIEPRLPELQADS